MTEIKQYIQSPRAQEIATLVIHYARMVTQYEQFLNTEFEGEVLTPERIRDYFGASEVFLDLPEVDAVVKYWLVGMDSTTGLPTIAHGRTTGYAIPRTEGGFDNCIPIPEECKTDGSDFKVVFPGVKDYIYKIVAVEITEGI